MNLRGDWAEVVSHIEATDRGGQPVDIKKILVRAVVTFVQVFLSVVIGNGALDVSANTGQMALMSAAGAGLSVFYNALTQYLSQAE